MGFGLRTLCFKTKTFPLFLWRLPSLVYCFSEVIDLICFSIQITSLWVYFLLDFIFIKFIYGVCLFFSNDKAVIRLQTKSNIQLKHSLNDFQLNDFFNVWFHCTTDHGMHISWPMFEVTIPPGKGKYHMKLLVWAALSLCFHKQSIWEV